MLNKCSHQESQKLLVRFLEYCGAQGAYPIYGTVAQHNNIILNYNVLRIEEEEEEKIQDEFWSCAAFKKRLIGKPYDQQP